jgi:hypothetical protein
LSTAILAMAYHALVGSSGPVQQAALRRRLRCEPRIDARSRERGASRRRCAATPRSHWSRSPGSRRGNRWDWCRSRKRRRPAPRRAAPLPAAVHRTCRPARWVVADQPRCARPSESDIPPVPAGGRTRNPPCRDGREEDAVFFEREEYRRFHLSVASGHCSTSGRVGKPRLVHGALAPRKFDVVFHHQPPGRLAWIWSELSHDRRDSIFTREYDIRAVGMR